MATAVAHFNATTFETFLKAFADARKYNTHIVDNCASVDDLLVKDAFDTAAGRTSEYYVSEDHLSGFIVRHDGELCAVFSRVKGRGAQLLANAKYRGATSLDCFEGYLSRFYAKHGFVVVASKANWGGTGLPRVVYMTLVGEAHSGLGTDRTGAPIVGA